MSPTTVANTSQLLKAIAANATEIIMEPGSYSTMNSSGHPNTVTISKRLFLAAGVSLAALATNADAFIRGGPYGAPSGASINFGAKTLAGQGGSPCGYTGTNALSITSGNTGSVWAIDSHNKLVPAGTYGTANILGAGPYTLTLTDGAVTFLITVNVVPNVWTIAPIPSGTNADTSTSCQLLTVANSASLAFGDTVSLRDGDYNPSRFGWRITRTAAPVGTWTGTWVSSSFSGGVYAKGGWASPNFVVIQAETAGQAILETLIIQGFAFPSTYFSFQNIRFPLLGGSAVSLITNASIVDFQGCTFQGLSQSNLADVISGSATTNYVTVSGCTFDTFRNGVHNVGAHQIVYNNTFTNSFQNGVQASDAFDLDVSFNTFIGLFAGPGVHTQFVQSQWDKTSGTYDGHLFVGNIMACGGQFSPTFSTGQGIFFTFNVTTTATFTGVVAAGNFYIGTAGRGISLTNCSGALVEGNTTVTDSSFTSFNPAGIILSIATGSTARNNATVGTTGGGGSTVFIDNVQLSGSALADYQTYFANPKLGAGNVSLAQILADWANKVGGPLDLTPAVGAIGTGYVDYIGRTTAFPY